MNRQNMELLRDRLGLLIGNPNFDINACFVLQSKMLDENSDVEIITQELNSEHKCGTTACAVGFFPIILPEYFIYTNRDGLTQVSRREKDPSNSYMVSREWLNISNEDWEFLFEPDAYEKNEQQDISAVIDHVNVLLNRE